LSFLTGLLALAMAITLPKIVPLDKPAIPDLFGVANSPIGYFLVAWQGDLLVRLTLLPAHKEKDLQMIMEDYDLPAHIRRDDAKAKELVATQIFPKNNWNGAPSGRLKLGFYGTEFQQQAMKEMLKIPSGKTISYGGLAKKAGAPLASRAIGSICAKNPIAFIVPCHRILAANGLGGYGYGAALKRQLLEWESNQ
jgi:AraC family transcriptional regulator of adaptative response/methylated-DNA-[protein]-cysteine methyltransferase